MPENIKQQNHDEVHTCNLSSESTENDSRELIPKTPINESLKLVADEPTTFAQFEDNNQPMEIDEIANTSSIMIEPQTFKFENDSEMMDIDNNNLQHFPDQLIVHNDEQTKTNAFKRINDNNVDEIHHEPTARRSKRPNIFKGPFAFLAAIIASERGEEENQDVCSLKAAQTAEDCADEPKYYLP